MNGLILVAKRRSPRRDVLEAVLAEHFKIEKHSGNWAEASREWHNGIHTIVDELLNLAEEMEMERDVYARMYAETRQLLERVLVELAKK